MNKKTKFLLIYIPTVLIITGFIFGVYKYIKDIHDIKYKDISYYGQNGEIEFKSTNYVSMDAYEEDLEDTCDLGDSDFKYKYDKLNNTVSFYCKGKKIHTKKILKMDEKYLIFECKGAIGGTCRYVSENYKISTEYKQELEKVRKKLIGKLYYDDVRQKEDDNNSYNFEYEYYFLSNKAIQASDKGENDSLKYKVIESIDGYAVVSVNDTYYMNYDIKNDKLYIAKGKSSPIIYEDKIKETQLFYKEISKDELKYMKLDYFNEDGTLDISNVDLESAYFYKEEDNDECYFIDSQFIYINNKTKEKSKEKFTPFERINNQIYFRGNGVIVIYDLDTKKVYKYDSAYGNKEFEKIDKNTVKDILK